MKKTYICPNTEGLAVLSDDQLMEGSVTVTVYTDNDADNSKEVLTRKTVWDDDAEDDGLGF